MGVLHERARGRDHAIPLIECAIAVEVIRPAILVPVDLPGRKEIRLPGADPVGIGLDLGEASLLGEILVGARVTRDHEIVRLCVGCSEHDMAVRVDILGIEELHKAHPGPGPQILEIGDLEALDDDRRGLSGPAGGLQHSDEAILKGQANRMMEGRVLRLGSDPDRPARARRLGFVRSMISCKVGIWSCPFFDGSRSAMACLARSCLISASVKSPANQSVTSTPSTLRVVLQAANSGRSATSVVPLSMGSCRAMRTPSRVDTRSGSMAQVPQSSHN